MAFFARTRDTDPNLELDAFASTPVERARFVTDHRIDASEHILETRAGQLRHLEFRFLYWDGGPSADVRWEHMVSAVQMYGVAEFGSVFAHGRAMSLSIGFGNNDFNYDDTIHSPDDITVGLLKALFDQLDTYSHGELDPTAVVVRLEPVLTDLVTEFRGRFLTKTLPKGLSRKWAFIPSDIKTVSNEQLEAWNDAGLCGPAALVYAKAASMVSNNRKHKAMPIQEIMLKAYQLLPLLPDLVVQSYGYSPKELGRILVDPDWATYRIIFFDRTQRKIDHLEVGGGWIWPLDQDRTKCDKKTLYLYQHRYIKGHYGHYYPVTSPSTFLHTHTGGATGKTFCYCCHRSFFNVNFASNTKDRSFRAHNCTGIRRETCEACKALFFSTEDLRAHLMHDVTNSERCEICSRTEFYGTTCYRQHLRHCKPNDPDAVEMVCETCTERYLSIRKHECPTFYCDLCTTRFDTRSLFDEHDCTFPTRRIFWEGITTKLATRYNRIVATWNSHWAYDFETTRLDCTRDDDMDDDSGLFVIRRYIHRIYLWSIELVPLDYMTDVLAPGYLLIDRLIAIFNDVVVPKLFDGVLDPELRYEIVQPHGTIRFFGSCIASFWEVCSSVLADRTSVDIKCNPRMWAHNGSRFDVKFLLHHLLETGYSMYAGGDTDQNFDFLTRTDDGCEITNRPRRAFRGSQPLNKRIGAHEIRLNHIGSAVIYLEAGGVTFCDSIRHLSGPLRNLPGMFGGGDTVTKGDFPYPMLYLHDRDYVHPMGLPALIHYGMDHMKFSRRKEVLEWYISTQRAMRVPTDMLRLLMKGVDLSDMPALNTMIYSDVFDAPPVPWHMHAECVDYLVKDMEVLTFVLAKYHFAGREVQERFWNGPDVDEDMNERFLSPLQCATAPSWALRIYQTWCLPQTPIYNLTNAQAAYVRNALRGGRTDLRCTYLKLTDQMLADGLRIWYGDVVSLYPFVQKCSASGTYFPVGEPLDVNEEMLTGLSRPTDLRAVLTFYSEQRNATQTGFARVDLRHITYSVHPVLGVERNNRLTFDLRAKEDLTFGIPELLEAMDNGEIEITRIRSLLLFAKGTDVFETYVDTFFEMKRLASCNPRNEGLRALSKLLLNSLWGKLGQRPYAQAVLTDDIGKLRDISIAERDGRIKILTQLFSGDKHWIKFQCNRVSDWKVKETAYHVAAFVAMWGRIILHRKFLKRYGTGLLYCDTDSGFGLSHKDDIPTFGSEIGGITNELREFVEKYTNADGTELVKGVDYGDDIYISEAVFLAPKSYSLCIRSVGYPLKLYKTVQKGFALDFASSKVLHHQSMKQLAFHHGKFLENDAFVTRFLDDADKTVHPIPSLLMSRGFSIRSGMTLGTICPTELVNERFYISGVYTKGQRHPDPRFPNFMVPHMEKRVLAEEGEDEDDGRLVPASIHILEPYCM